MAKKKVASKTTNYNLGDENAKRQYARRSLHLLSILKEVGYPARSFFSTATEEIREFLGVKEETNDFVVLEFGELPNDQLQELVEFVEGRGVEVTNKVLHTYDDGCRVTRLAVKTKTLPDDKH